MVVLLTDLLRWFSGGKKKEKSLFRSERDAYDFCRRAYKKNGGPTPELMKAYEFYLANSSDGCDFERRNTPN